MNAAQQLHAALGYGDAPRKDSKPPRGQRAVRKAINAGRLLWPAASGTYVNPVRNIGEAKWPRRRSNYLNSRREALRA